MISKSPDLSSCFVVGRFKKNTSLSLVVIFLKSTVLESENLVRTSVGNRFPKLKPDIELHAWPLYYMTVIIVLLLLLLIILWASVITIKINKIITICVAYTIHSVRVYMTSHLLYTHNIIIWCCDIISFYAIILLRYDIRYTRSRRSAANTYSVYVDILF